MSTVKGVLDHRREQDEWGIPLCGSPYVLASENDARELLADMVQRGYVDSDICGAVAAIHTAKALKYLQGGRIFGMYIKAAA